ncbi:MAG: S1 RNA-binding domain-containing protein [Candidatus Omnitrophica bacterium]|jgi:predicted RNA-binding protein with RPS1 domain|nr:S1 RNA-binding domain-containing protein [Candidatus Omnitrophota bacterium]
MEQMIKAGDIVEAEIFRITSFGAFVRLKDGQKGFIHISQIADGFVQNISDHLRLGSNIKARVLKIEDGKIELTLKPFRQKTFLNRPARGFRMNVFEDKLQGFALKAGPAN